MLVVYRQEGRWEDRQFREFPEFLGPGDCLVLNDSRVFPARLFGHRVGVHSLPIGRNNPKRHEYLSGEVEVFLLRPVSADGRDWEALVRPGRKMPVGERIRFGGGLEAEIVARGEFGERTLRFPAPATCSRSSKKSATSPAAVYQTARYRRRPRTLPDRLRTRARIGGRPHRGAAFHAGDSGCLPAARAPTWPPSPCTWAWGRSSRCTPNKWKTGRLHAERYAIARRMPPVCARRRAAWPWAPPASAPSKPPGGGAS